MDKAMHSELEILKLYPALQYLEIKLDGVEVAAIKLAMREYAEQENQSLRSELQKQKELNAEGWILSRQRMPEYDGFYYVYGFQHHACGNVTPFHMIVECRMNQWVKSDIGYQMTYWRQLLEPPKMESDEY